jgi:hypothetical protein
MSIQTVLARAVDRRKFLTLSAAGLAYIAAACSSGPVATAPLTPTTGKSTPIPLPTRNPAATTDNWSAFASSLQGNLIRPGDSHYTTAHQLFSTRFDNILPAGIASCASPADVQKSLAFAQRFNLPVAARSGGHSYAGYSTTTGLMLDLSPMNVVTVNTANGTVSSGGGAHLIDVYATLAQFGQVIPAGSCPTVGIAGLTLGGGVGVLGRKFGLTCDNLLSAQVVLANGEIVTCDQNTHADLFWALRGGGGGNFGIVTSFTFQTHAVAELSLFTLNWPWSSAASMVNAWQNWGPQAPDELWSNCLLLGSAEKSEGPTARVNGVYVGGSAPLNALLQQLISQVGVAPTSSYVYTDPLLETMMVEAGCYGESVAACHLPTQNPQGTLTRDTSQARSDYFTGTLPAQAIESLIDSINSRQSTALLNGGGIGIDAYGGAINRVASTDTAFVHRDALFSIQYTASWNAGDSPAIVSANKSWLSTTWQGMRPYASGEAYQNYIDPDLGNWQQAYYGANLPRLQQVKATYDPGNLFHFAQSIPLG